MARLLPSYYTEAHEPSEVAFTCNTSEIYLGAYNTITFTVTLSNGVPYTGTVHFSYSSGVSGDTEATCTDGVVTIRVACSLGAEDQTVTISVDESTQVKAGSATFTMEVNVGTAWEFDTIDNCTTAGVPFLYTSTCYMVIDWGDGTVVDVASDDDFVHTYSTAGQYRIKAASNFWTYISMKTSANEDPESEVVAAARASIAKIYKMPQLNFTSIYSIWAWYQELVEVEEGLFDNNPQIQNFGGIFYECTKLASIPDGLFDNNTAATTFEAAFYNCASLEAIPDGLFDNCPLVTSFMATFQYCANIATIPDGLFKNNTQVTDFYQTFYNSGVTAVPAGLFADKTAATTFYGVFWACSSLVTLGAGIFSGCTNAENFYGAFANSAITNLPADTFENCSSASNLATVFYGCTGLTAIPSGLFDDCVNAQTVMGAFYYCLNIASVPDDLFRQLTVCTDFSYLFTWSGIQNIPSLRYNTAATNVEGAFNACSAASGSVAYVGSSVVTSADYFMYANNSSSFSAYVPSGSTTCTTFNNATLIGATVYCTL